jgi:hypothetical protein
MTIELTEELEQALNQQANSRGVSLAIYVREVLERDLEAIITPKLPVKPFKNSRGILAKYGTAPTAEEIDENRVDMFRNSIFARDVE